MTSPSKWPRVWTRAALLALVLEASVGLTSRGSGAHQAPGRVTARPAASPLPAAPASAGHHCFPARPGRTSIIHLPQIPLGTGPGVRFITAGADGNVWFTENSVDHMGRITPRGHVTEYFVPTRSNGFASFPIVSGPNGDVWFGEAGGSDVEPRIGCVSPQGAITEYPITVTAGFGPIAAGADGNIWFSMQPANSRPTTRASLGRMTPRGVVTTFPLPRGVEDPNILVAGPGKALWLAQASSGRATSRSDA